MSPRTATHPDLSDLCDVRLVNQQRVEETRRDMKPAESVMLLAETFRTLGDPNRLRIVWALSRAELCVCDLAAALGMSQSAVSHSLRALRQLRLVRYRRENKTAYYRLDDDHITHLVADGFEHVDERV